MGRLKENAPNGFWMGARGCPTLYTGESRGNGPAIDPQTHDTQAAVRSTDRPREPPKLCKPQDPRFEVGMEVWFSNVAETEKVDKLQQSLEKPGTHGFGTEAEGKDLRN